MPSGVKETFILHAKAVFPLADCLKDPKDLAEEAVSIFGVKVEDPNQLFADMPPASASASAETSELSSESPSS